MKIMLCPMMCLLIVSCNRSEVASERFYCFRDYALPKKLENVLNERCSTRGPLLKVDGINFSSSVCCLGKISEEDTKSRWKITGLF